MDDYLEFRPKEGGDDAVVGVSRRDRICFPPAGDYQKLPKFIGSFARLVVCGLRISYLHLDTNPPIFFALSSPGRTIPDTEGRPGGVCRYRYHARSQWWRILARWPVRSALCTLECFDVTTHAPSCGIAKTAPCVPFAFLLVGCCILLGFVLALRLCYALVVDDVCRRCGAETGDHNSGGFGFALRVFHPSALTRAKRLPVLRREITFQPRCVSG